MAGADGDESVMTIEAARVQLRLYSPAQLLALIEGDTQFERSFGLPVADGLGAFMRSDEVSRDWLERLRGTSVPDPWVHGFAVVDRASRSVIGSLGFKGSPDADGIAEIAYGIVPAFQGLGYATEVTAAGVAFAWGQGVRRLRAHTLPTARASQRVLEKCGFELIGAVDDPEDGLVWRWERSSPEVSE